MIVHSYNSIQFKLSRCVLRKFSRSHAELFPESLHGHTHTHSSGDLIEVKGQWRLYEGYTVVSHCKFFFFFRGGGGCFTGRSKRGGAPQAPWPPVTGTSLKSSSDGTIRIFHPVPNRLPSPPLGYLTRSLHPNGDSKVKSSYQHPHPHPHQMHSAPPPTHEVCRTRSQVTIAPSILKINLAREMSYSIIHCVIFACKLILIQCDKEN